MSGGSAFRVEEVAGGFQLLTRPQFASWLRRLCSAPVEIRLSAPAMETLAVVAYRQPVLRAEIEAIRGVQCGEVLRQLIERDLVRIVGRPRNWAARCCMVRPGSSCRFLACGTWKIYPKPLCRRLQNESRTPSPLAATILNKNLRIHFTIPGRFSEETRMKTTFNSPITPEETYGLASTIASEPVLAAILVHPRCRQEGGGRGHRRRRR